MGKHTTSGLGGFMSGASIRFSKMKGGSGGADAWRDQLMRSKPKITGDRPRTTGTKLPPLHSVHKGTVVSIQAFGCFVQLGAGDEFKDGLLHLSCMVAGERLERVEDRLALGDTVFVKVSEVREQELKYSLDMRYLNQQDGTPKYTNDDDDRPARGGKGGGSRRDPQDADAGSQDEAEEDPMAHRSSKRKAEEEPPARPPPAEDSSSEDSQERKKIRKKLEKAAKKLEKTRKKAEKLRKKLKKGGSSSSSSSAS